MKRLAILVFACSAFALDLRANYKDDIGYTALQALLGGSIPDGSTIKVSFIEGNAESNPPPWTFMPSASSGDVLLDVLAASGGGTSWHADLVANWLYRDGGIAPMLGNSVAGTDYPIHVYEVNHWLTFRLRSGSNAPVVETQDIQNHSWVGSVGAEDQSVLRRYDYMIHRDDFVGVVGVNNSVGADYDLLSSAYNIITAGRTDGVHSYALTTINGAGRQRIHVVAPAPSTSEATGLVSAASALMLDTAKRMGAPDGARHETVKAVLMSGATKTDVPSYSYLVHGAGEINVLRSHEIMSAGKQTPSALTDLLSPKGWDYSNVAAESENTYRVFVEEGSELSVTLAWQPLLTVTGSNYDDIALELANLDLSVYFNPVNDSSVGTLLTDAEHGTNGTSLVDNVEHLWWEHRNAGYYTFMVSNNSAWLSNYALAWHAVPEPSRIMLTFGAFALVCFRRRRD